MTSRPILADRLGLRFPIFLAPMAGGPSTPELAAAVSAAGGLGALGAAYLSPARIGEEAERVRALTGAPFALNLFVPTPPETPDDAAVERALAALAPFHAELGLPRPARPARASEDFAAQFDAALAARPALLSFTFGRLDADRTAALRAAGVLIVGTATTAEEARVLAADGVDAIVAQGGSAGGHRGTFLHDPRDALHGTLDLVRAVRAAVDLPVVAAGGLMDGPDVRAALDAGADAVQLGTAFLRADEAGTGAAFRAALADPGSPAPALVTAFSGRAARGLPNRFSETFPADAVLPYPHQNALTRPLRTEAARQGRAEFLSLWAGDGARRTREGPAAEILLAIAREAGLG